jgi:hypothetical protein
MVRSTTPSRNRSRWVLGGAAAAVAVVAAAVIAVTITGREAPLPAPPPAPATPVAVPALGTDATSVDQLNATLTDMGRRSISWNVTYMSDDAQVDRKLLDAAADRGVTHYVITLEFWSLQREDHVLGRIENGEVDNHLRGIAGDLRTWQQKHPGTEIIIRPLHEANLPSYPWSFAAGNGHLNNESEFAPAWHHIWSVMRNQNPQLKFFLCPNGGDSGYSWGVPPAEVDYVGADRYNRSQESGDWHTPAEVHDQTIEQIQALYPGKPYVIAETGTSEPGQGVTGHSKAEWFTQLAEWMKGPATTQFHLTAVCYFDHDKSEQAGNGNDWRIYPQGQPDAEASRSAFKSAFADFR